MGNLYVKMQEANYIYEYPESPMSPGVKCESRSQLKVGKVHYESQESVKSIQSLFWVGVVNYEYVESILSRRSQLWVHRVDKSTRSQYTSEYAKSIMSRWSELCLSMPNQLWVGGVNYVRLSCQINYEQAVWIMSDWVCQINYK